MKIAAPLAALVTLIGLAGCATMSEEQCLAGDWGGKGWQDGLTGHEASRLDDHAKACAKVGVAPNTVAYMSAREEGLRTYCTWQSGFEQGRAGHSYRGVCTPAQEQDFLPAYEDGRTLYSAERAVEDARSTLRSAYARVENHEDKLEAKIRELHQQGLSREQRRAIRDRIEEVRGELRSAYRDVEIAEIDLRHAMERADPVIYNISRRYGL